MPDLEAVGDAATGGVLASAVEPDTGETADGHSDNGDCLNCGAELAGAYCYRCGQRGHVPRTIAAWWHDFVHGVLHVDGKLWRTLGMLVWRPGELTRRYVHGERARFVSPIALFLFSVFLMFAVINLAGSPDFSGQRSDLSAEERRQILEETLAETEKERADAVRAGESTAVHDAIIAKVRSQLEAPAVAGNGDVRILAGERMPATQAVEVDLSEAPAPLNWFDEAYRKAKQNPELLFYKIQTNAYKFSWALIPLSVPFVWLLFLHRRRYRQLHAYDHTVFVTYSLSFMTLLVVAATLAGKLVGSNDLAVFAITLIPPVHMYRQLRGAYSLSRASALWRTAALVLFALMCILIFLLVLVAAGVLG